MNFLPVQRYFLSLIDFFIPISTLNSRRGSDEVLMRFSDEVLSHRKSWIPQVPLLWFQKTQKCVKPSPVTTDLLYFRVYPTHH